MANYCCSIKNCAKRKIEGFGVFKIPDNDEIKQKWLRYMRENGSENLCEQKTYRICENHFEENLISRNGKISLKRNAFPTIFTEEEV